MPRAVATYNTATTAWDANGTTPTTNPAGGGGGIGATTLVYKYTVTGSDKASIDTGTDTPQAGSGDWANGDLLIFALYARTDEAVAFSTVKLNLNNDTGANYDLQYLFGNNAASGQATALAQTGWSLGMAGASLAASYFSVWRVEIPNYTGTTGYKLGVGWQSQNDSTAANNQVTALSLGYRSTSAVTRWSAAPVTAGKKFKVGTQLLVHKLWST